jgi:signal transduction histidine kinase/response regulator of citrate/malate metabolism
MESDSFNNLTFQESLNDSLLSILIIEDNRGDVVILSNLLRASGLFFTLTEASSLSAALALVIDHDFDVILLDLGLPDSVGLETLKKLQVFKVVPPVVVMTGLDDEDAALASLREGAQDYLVKNRLTSENILKSIKYSIERKKLQNLQKKNTQRFSLLSNTTVALNECDDIPFIYTIICQSIRVLLEKTLTISVEFENNLTFRISNFDRFEPWLHKINELSGIDLKTHVFNVADQKKELNEYFSDGKLHEVKGGLYEIFPTGLDLKSSLELEKSMGISYIYAIGFLRNKNHYGGTLIFASECIGNDDINIIENICSQASISIYRGLIRKNLKLSEQRYQQLNQELEQKVKERTGELENANSQLNRELKERTLAEEALITNEAQLRELNATKDKFFNIVAHDLKNPFTSLLGATELLFENIEKMDTDKIKKLAQILNDSAKSGYAILLNLLDWSRSQTGLIVINPERINLKKLIDENITDLQLYLTNKEIKLYSDAKSDIYIFADKNMLNTVLRNLMSNAIKFTHRGGSININASIKDNHVSISVKDTGIGISKDNIVNLFRIDSKYMRPGTDKEQGTGLGLKLSKEFVEKLGGKIWVESIENKGSEFIFTFPLITAPTPG